MPYATIHDLPPGVKNGLTSTQQKRWIAIFNSVYIKKGEKKAFQYANGIVKRKDKK